MTNPKHSQTRVKLRCLSPADLDEALAWRMEVLDEVFAEDEPWPHGLLREANAAFLTEHLGTDLIFWIASMDGVDVGCGAFCIQPELPSPDNPSGLAAYLMNIYLRPAFRGQGAGHDLVSGLVAQARERDIGKIYLEATEAGRPVYEGLGFSKMSAMMKL